MGSLMEAIWKSTQQDARFLSEPALAGEVELLDLLRGVAVADKHRIRGFHHDQVFDSAGLDEPSIAQSDIIVDACSTTSPRKVLPPSLFSR